MNKYIFLFYFLVATSCFGQSGIKLSMEEFNVEMKPIIRQLNNPNIVLRFKKETFRDLNDPTPIESSNGVIYRGSGISYKMINAGITVLQTQDLAIYIDSTSKFVQVTEIDSSMKTLNTFNDFTEATLSQYDLIKTTYSGYIVLKAIPKFSNEGTLEFFIDTKKKSLYKLIISLPPANYFMESEDDETIESPYITLVYEPIVALKKNEVSFSESMIIVKDKKDNLTLTPIMAGYQLHDARYKPKK
ncbi:hypothetical protein [Fluviicola taffensis]|uniref:DUF4292 domain-containing protein n=1 Tax=Fluviicola taffensis (strain DSM 16823 / NCIMB 13979 / RW262) TaxID=755732 RepID=F2IEX5_FLUTR|nr:hypothetical protein [Fluviicola taffensis]AEA42440.1 hypothetical protein Fluta_0434 [Fluviicola taffensis DSM 16823]